MKLIVQVMGVSKTPLANEQEQDEVQMKKDWLFAMVKTLRADMQNDKLYPPGDVYIMVSRIRIGYLADE